MNKKVTTGRAQRKELRSSTVHIEDDFALVIGFEVEGFEQYFRTLKTFWNNTFNVHYVLDNPGHTFMYLSKNNRVTHFFSLGPEASNHGNEGTTKERMHGKGTPDYWISDETRLFRFYLNESEYEILANKIDERRKLIENGDEYYRVIDNHTCASAVHDIIKTVWKDIPAGESRIAYGDKTGLEFSPPINVVNPYAFYHDLVEAGFKFRVLKPTENPEDNIWDSIIFKEKTTDPFYYGVLQ